MSTNDLIAAAILLLIHFDLSTYIMICGKYYFLVDKVTDMEFNSNENYVN